MAAKSKRRKPSTQRKATNSKHSQYSKILMLCALFELLSKLPEHRFTFVLAYFLMEILSR